MPLQRAHKAQDIKMIPFLIHRLYGTSGHSILVILSGHSVMACHGIVEERKVGKGGKTR